MHASLKTCCKDREAFVLCNRCFLCEEAAESASHLLIKCGQSTQIYVGWNGQCHLSLNMRNLLECRQHQRVDIRAKEIWRTIPSCIMWMVWLERNRRCFEGQKVISVVNFFRRLLIFFSWCKGI